MSDESSGHDRPQVWIDGAEEALRIAEQQLDSGRHLWAIFFCHLAIEKMLKAAVIHKTGQLAPKTHHLLHLLKLSGLCPPAETLTFLRRMNMLSVPTRYPEDQEDIRRTFDHDRTQGFLDKTIEAIRWIRESMRQF
ncbi:MAG TPA: HEPN domain-containing protein [bacterium]|nr:HEPN domain-containing protein [bacterium]